MATSVQESCKLLRILAVSRSINQSIDSLGAQGQSLVTRRSIRQVVKEDIVSVSQQTSEHNWFIAAETMFSQQMVKVIGAGNSLTTT